MKRAAGLWIDHRKALIVFISDDGEESKEIESDMEKHTRFSGGSRSEQGGGEDQQDRQFTGHLNTYYDAVIARHLAAREQAGPPPVAQPSVPAFQQPAGFPQPARGSFGRKGL